MRKRLLQSPKFMRRLRYWLKAHPEKSRDVQSALEKLSNDDADPSLNVHKLRGALSGCWACSAGYDLRIVFEKVTNDAIRLLTLGTHDEVY